MRDCAYCAYQIPLGSQPCPLCRIGATCVNCGEVVQNHVDTRCLFASTRLSLGFSAYNLIRVLQTHVDYAKKAAIVKYLELVPDFLKPATVESLRGLQKSPYGTAPLGFASYAGKPVEILHVKPDHSSVYLRGKGVNTWEDFETLRHQRYFKRYKY